MVTQFLDDLDQALQGLSLANAGAGFAAWSLFVLNRGDRPVTNGYFYALKRLALDEFTRRGYLTSTETLLQELPCWHTAAYNDGWDDYCPKCDNIGVPKLPLSKLRCSAASYSSIFKVLSPRPTAWGFICFPL